MAASRSEALARGRATYQDVIDAPAHRVAEIVDGTLYTHPRPAPPHTIASSVLVGELNPPFHRGRGGPGGWWILNEPELHLGEDILVPDLAGWRRERMPEPPDTAYFSVAPDWVWPQSCAGSSRRRPANRERERGSVDGRQSCAMSRAGCRFARNERDRGAAPCARSFRLWIECSPCCLLIRSRSSEVRSGSAGG